jgi:hypothetical protein
MRGGALTSLSLSLCLAVLRKGPLSVLNELAWDYHLVWPAYLVVDRHAMLKINKLFGFLIKVQVRSRTTFWFFSLAALSPPLRAGTNGSVHSDCRSRSSPSRPVGFS